MPALRTTIRGRNYQTTTNGLRLVRTTSPRHKLDNQGGVYLLTRREGPDDCLVFKIGHSSDPLRRFEQHAAACAGVEMELQFVYWVPWRIELERAIHDALEFDLDAWLPPRCCSGCRKRHIEHFNPEECGSVEEVERVFRAEIEKRGWDQVPEYFAA